MIAINSAFSFPTLTLVWRAERADTVLEEGPALRRARLELEGLGANVDDTDDHKGLRFDSVGRRRGGQAIMFGRVRAQRTGERIAVTVQASFLPSLLFAFIFGMGPALLGLPVLMGIVLGAFVVANAAITAGRLRNVAQSALSLNPPGRAV